MLHCLRLETQLIFCAFAFAEDKTGSSIAARIAMMAITTSNSMRVKADSYISTEAARWGPTRPTLMVMEPMRSAINVPNHVRIFPFGPVTAAGIWRSVRDVTALEIL